MDQNQVSTRGPVSLGKTEFYWKWVLFLVGQPAQVPISGCIQSLLTPAATPSIFLTHTLSALILWWFIILLYFHPFIKLTRTQQKVAYDELDYSENNFWQLILASPPLSQIVELHSHKPIFLPNKIMLWKNIRTFCDIYFPPTFQMNSTIRKSFCFHFLFSSSFFGLFALSLMNLVR